MENEKIARLENEKIARLVRRHLESGGDKSLKFGIVEGRVNQFVVMNATDIPLTYGKNINWQRYIDMAVGRDFHGTLVFDIADGDVVGYGYLQTYAGENLRRILG